MCSSYAVLDTGFYIKNSPCPFSPGYLCIIEGWKLCAESPRQYIMTCSYIFFYVITFYGSIMITYDTFFYILWVIYTRYKIDIVVNAVVAWCCYAYIDSKFILSLIVSVLCLGWKKHIGVIDSAFWSCVVSSIPTPSLIIHMS